MIAIEPTSCYFQILEIELRISQIEKGEPVPPPSSPSTTHGTFLPFFGADRWISASAPSVDFATPRLRGGSAGAAQPGGGAPGTRVRHLQTRLGRRLLSGKTGELAVELGALDEFLIVGYSWEIVRNIISTGDVEIAEGTFRSTNYSCCNNVVGLLLGQDGDILGIKTPLLVDRLRWS